MASVTYRQVTKRFGDVVAVNDLNLEIADKEFLVLVAGSPLHCAYWLAWRR
jgi:multiple sugar transport system ATP-binding protein